jgi:hypothetical protein
MLALSRPVLLMRMGTGNLVGYTYAFKEGVECLVLATPIRLNLLVFTIKLPFNKCLKISKALKNFRFVAK